MQLPPPPWREVSSAEFNQFLRTYPQPLEPNPPLPNKARYCEYRDCSLGAWPDNVVAQCLRHHRSVIYMIRTNIPYTQTIDYPASITQDGNTSL